MTFSARARSPRQQTPLAPGAQILQLPVSALVPDPANPRVHKRPQVRAIARSITAFGFNAPILVDAASRVVAGHGRLEAAKLLGLATVPVIRLEHLSEPQLKAYMIADNRLNERSSWDDAQLAQRLKELQDVVLDFEIEATGFEPPEIDLRIQSIDDPDAMDAADEFEVQQTPPVSRPGDLWFLGPHRLACGSALDPECYRLLMGEEQAAAVFTDPPYNVPVKGHVSGLGRARHREFPMASGEMSREQFTNFLSESLGCARLHCVEAAVVFMCMDWRHLEEANTALQREGYELINLCVWVKSNGGMGSFYRSRHELVFVARPTGMQHRNNVQLGSFGRNRTNVWNYPGMNGFARRGQPKATDIHPTVKPIRMVADAILDVTGKGDIVLDPFCGSGTTILAAERTGRRGFAIELDPAYVDLCITRWQAMSKQTATLADGRSFETVRAQREAADGQG